MKILKIAIDPDVKKSGVAILNKNSILFAVSFNFFELQEYLKITAEHIELVIIEASWLISHNFTASKGSIAARLKIANHTGANHEVGRKIAEMCAYLGIEYKLVRPLKKMWKGPKGKITHQELMNIWQVKKLGFNKKQTNQEERDAILFLM
jgi:hypothetical protein